MSREQDKTITVQSLAAEMLSPVFTLVIIINKFVGYNDKCSDYWILQHCMKAL